MRPADPGQLRSAWLTSGISDHLRSCGTSSDGYKMGTKFAPVLATRDAMFEPDLAAGTWPGPKPVKVTRCRVDGLAEGGAELAARGASLSARLDRLPHLDRRAAAL